MKPGGQWRVRPEPLVMPQTSPGHDPGAGWAPSRRRPGNNTAPPREPILGILVGFSMRELETSHFFHPHVPPKPHIHPINTPPRPQNRRKPSRRNEPNSPQTLTPNRLNHQHPQSTASHTKLPALPQLPKSPIPIVAPDSPESNALPFLNPGPSPPGDLQPAPSRRHPPVTAPISPPIVPRLSIIVREVNSSHPSTHDRRLSLDHDHSCNPSPSPPGFVSSASSEPGSSCSDSSSGSSTSPDKRSRSTLNDFRQPGGTSSALAARSSSTEINPIYRLTVPTASEVHKGR